jgi:hypothetical protein
VIDSVLRFDVFASALSILILRSVSQSDPAQSDVLSG